MANSVDPDQTAPKEQSDPGLHSLHSCICPGLWYYHGIFGISKE